MSISLATHSTSAFGERASNLFTAKRGRPGSPSRLHRADPWPRGRTRTTCLGARRTAGPASPKSGPRPSATAAAPAIACSAGWPGGQASLLQVLSARQARRICRIRARQAPRAAVDRFPCDRHVHPIHGRREATQRTTRHRRSAYGGLIRQAMFTSGHTLENSKKCAILSHFLASPKRLPG
jgi:hypothetical protein